MYNGGRRILARVNYFVILLGTSEGKKCQNIILIVTRYDLRFAHTKKPA